MEMFCHISLKIEASDTFRAIIGFEAHVSIHVALQVGAGVVALCASRKIAFEFVVTVWVWGYKSRLCHF